jgi:hypothetical protein
MSASILLGLLAVVCIVLLFKMMGFLFKLAVVALVIGAGYWYLAPHFGAPPLPF